MRFLAALLALVGAAMAQNRIPVVISSTAAPEERLAAAELSRYLARIWAGREFPVMTQAPASGARIVLGTPRTLGKLTPQRKPAREESFVVTHTAGTGIVAGADGRGVLFGVYALLEKLGCGFYLSFDALPAARTAPFDFAAWELESAPLYAHRMVFNWHNFLSSGSTWDLPDWKKWIDQSAKMRFNTIMVHAYGNNPMVGFRFGGQEKAVGYLATTARGRDWGTQHVGDVRTLIGGDLFREAVFGSVAGKAPEESRAAAAVSLMQQVFSHARSRAMHVTFALDVDTETASPQNLIATLPASARFTGGKLQLVNPDTPEGFHYYREQVRQLLATYPEIDRLAVWFRDGATPWRNLKTAEFPEAWRREFAELCAREPVLSGAAEAPGLFATAKVVSACGRALRELGHGRVKLATGSWRLNFLKVADLVMPREAAIIPLDWATEFDTEDGRGKLRAVRPGRELIPVVWAHHDDRTYIGRPYTPYANFASQLEGVRAAGFGIIHWTTRPLDLYFKSSVEQVWSATKNQPLAETCRRMAARAFAPALAEAGGEYLRRFVTEAPMFGRETRDLMMDVPLKEPEAAMAAGRSRLELLARMDAASLAPASREHLEYFRDYERFMLAFFETHAAWERVEKMRKVGAVEDARREVTQCRPEEVIRLYAQAARHGGASRGEQALVISLNLRWLPYIQSARQALGLDAVRVKFGATQHEPLAQSPGRHTFFVDAEGRQWLVRGEQETGAPVAPEGGIRVTKPVALRMTAFAGEKLAPGRYTLELEFAPRPAAAVELEIADGGGTLLTERVRTGGAARFPLEIRAGVVDVKLRPASGEAVLLSATLAPGR